MAADLLCENAHTRVTRQSLPGGRVLRKEAKGPGREKLLRHEQTMLERLAGVPGVVRLALAPPPPGAILLEDVPGVPLSHLPMPLSPAEVTRLGLELARTVAAVHRRGVVHRGINPDSILVSDLARVPYLFDFTLATTFTEVRPEFAHHAELAGSLPYLAPEQTGRTGRPVDQRADLYAMGAILYQLATGVPPFDATDPLQLSHDHLAHTPTPPSAVNLSMPEPLSAIIMHLLATEPDNRYQTADGLAHDLVQVRPTDPDQRLFQLGMKDFPVRLRSPSRLVGRDHEINVLSSALAKAAAGSSRAVMISGTAGVGKTALADQLRPMVTANGGWFTAGKFDQYRRGHEFDGVRQAFRKLARLLLAEPESDLAGLRQRLRQALGDNAGVFAAMAPEFGTVLRVDADSRPGPTDDPLSSKARLQCAGVEALRTIASPNRPVVLFIDDLQWAGPTPLGFVDMIVTNPDLAGLLVVGAYRDSEVDAAHPLGVMLSRWYQEQAGVDHIKLSNLPTAELTSMLADMLRVDLDRAANLATAVTTRTGGNPYETVELLNSLQHHHVLVPDAAGWRWEETTLQRHLDRAGVADLLAERAEATPPDTRELLWAMACLGGQVELTMLRAATDLSHAEVEERLMPALDAGLLVLEPGGRDSVRFRHDRVQETILHRLEASQRLRTLRLRLARRLANQPELHAAAAEQYLPVIDAVRHGSERRQVVELLRSTADQAQTLSDHALVERCLGAAATLIEKTDTAGLIEVHTGRHQALYSLGRLAEADTVYHALEELCERPLDLAAAAWVQVSSLTNRNNPSDGIALGLTLLAQLGYPMPAEEELSEQIARGLTELERWLDEPDWDEDQRPELDDPTLVAVGALINRMMPPAYFSDHITMAWLSLTAWRIWVEHAPGRTLIGPISHLGFVAMSQRGDYRGGNQLIRRVLALSELRRYGPESAQVRFLYALGGCWFEPLEETVRQARDARQQLIHGGDFPNASYTYYVTIFGLLEFSPSLANYVAPEIEAGLAFAGRIGDYQTIDSYHVTQQLTRVLQSGDGGSTDDLAAPSNYPENQQARAHAHIARALAAALLGDRAKLAQHSAAAMPLLSLIVGTYPTAVAHVLRALSLAYQARSAAARDCDKILAELDTVNAWIAARAADGPINFRHLQRLVEAERAWTTGDFQAAAYAFDTAQSEVSDRCRPWHQALILEEAARFWLAHGMEYSGRTLLIKARQAYAEWGAGTKVDQLDWSYPAIQAATIPSPYPGLDRQADLPVRRSSIMTGIVDLLGILAAARALSSETTVEGLRAQVVEALSAMTGATRVHLLLWNGDKHRWLLTTGKDDREMIPLAAAEHLVPASVVRYAERTREPLVIDDATQDDRFARDRYLAGLDRCSLLAVPIISQGVLKAMVLLENRLIRGAFSAERLDGIMLIAGQLAVSLDNAMVYASLERRVTERTEELALANKRLEVLSVTDALTGLANRRRLEEVLSAEWLRSQRSGAPVSVAMADIDYFKRYNDHYGHAAGDRCLQHVATVLRSHIREADLAARYGGEEFAIVLPDADINTALGVAERLRSAVAASARPHPLSPDRVVTVSIGVAAMVPPPHSMVEQLIELADAELYRAKRNGRNQVSGYPRRKAAPVAD